MNHANDRGPWLTSMNMYKSSGQRKFTNDLYQVIQYRAAGIA